MKDRVGILINLKNRTVLTYIVVALIGPLLISGFVEYESLQRILDIAIQIIAILGIIDDPNTDYFLKK